MTRLFLLPFLTATLYAQDPGDIVLRSVNVDDSNYRIARSYTFLQRDEHREIGRDGKVASRESKTFDVTVLDSSLYRRLVARNDQPLPPSDEAKEQKKLQENMERARKQTAEQSAKRRAQVDKEKEKERALFRQIPEAFHLKITGEEVVGGKPAWIIAAEPRAGYRPPNSEAKIFTKLRGRMWIDKETYHWVRLEAESIDTVSFGLFLARLAKGAKLSVEHAFVNGEVWLPKMVQVQGSARLALLKNVRLDEEITFSRYRKFQSDSSVTLAGEAENQR